MGYAEQTLLGPDDQRRKTPLQPFLQKDALLFDSFPLTVE